VNLPVTAFYSQNSGKREPFHPLASRCVPFARCAHVAAETVSRTGNNGPFTVSVQSLSFLSPFSRNASRSSLPSILSFALSPAFILQRHASGAKVFFSSQAELYQRTFALRGGQAFYERSLDREMLQRFDGKHRINARRTPFARRIPRVPAAAEICGGSEPASKERSSYGSETRDDRLHRPRRPISNGTRRVLMASQDRTQRNVSQCCNVSFVKFSAVSSHFAFAENRAKCFRMIVGVCLPRTAK